MPRSVTEPSDTNLDRKPSAGHLCVICQQELLLVLRHVSPGRPGAPPLTMEFYECSVCNSCHVFRWTVADRPEKRAGITDRRRTSRQDRRKRDE